MRALRNATQGTAVGKVEDGGLDAGGFLLLELVQLKLAVKIAVQSRIAAETQLLGGIGKSLVENDVVFIAIESRQEGQLAIGRGHGNRGQSHGGSGGSCCSACRGKGEEVTPTHSLSVKAVQMAIDKRFLREIRKFRYKSIHHLRLLKFSGMFLVARQTGSIPPLAKLH